MLPFLISLLLFASSAGGVGADTAAECPPPPWWTEAHGHYGKLAMAETQETGRYAVPQTRTRIIVDDGVPFLRFTVDTGATRQRFVDMNDGPDPVGAWGPPPP